MSRSLRLLGAFGVLLVVTMLMRSSQNMAQTTFPLVASELLSLHATSVGVLAAASSAVGILTMVLLARRVPTHRARQSLLVAMLSMAASFVIIAVAHDSVVLLAGVLVLGFGGGLAFPTLITAAGAAAGESAAPGERDRPIALLGVALSVSLAVGPFLETGVLSVTAGSLRATFLVFGVLPVMGAAVLGAVLVQRRATSHSTLRRASSGAGQGAPAPPLSSRVARRGVADPVTGEVASVPSVRSAAPPLSVAAALADRDFQLALSGELVYAAPFAAVVVFGALLARHDYGLSPAAIEVAFGVFFAVSFVVRSVLVWRSPIHHKLRLFRWSAALTILGLVVLGLGHELVVLLVAMALLGVPHGLTFPLAMGLVAENRPHHELAAINAHLSASVQAVSLVLPLLLGVGIDSIGYRTMFLILVAPVGVAALFQQWVARARARDHSGASLA